MAITFPAGLDVFFSKLPIQSAEPDLQDSYEAEETGRGEIITTEMGERLWQMTVNLRPMEYDEAEEIQALIRMFRRAGATFLAYPIPRMYPRFDPNGSAILSSGLQPVLHTVGANMRDIRIGGLPPGYRLAGGDFISWAYGSNPTRNALHQVVGATVSAASNGITPNLEVNPPVRLGYETPQNVAITRPRMKALILPGSASPAKMAGMWATGASFTIRQTLGR